MSVSRTFSKGSKSRLTLTLKKNAFNIFLEPEDHLWTFDLSGRIIGMFIDSRNYRRTLNNHFFEKTRFREDEHEFRSVNPIPFDQAWKMIENGYSHLTTIEDLPVEFLAIKEKITSFNKTRLQQDGERFNAIYLPISILPPDQYLALVIQITEGCNYNQCTFCNFYRDRPFKIKTGSELELHLANVKSYFNGGIQLRKSIFLADANALVIPQKRLVKHIGLIKNSFPALKSFYSFIDVFTGIKKTKQDFSRLAEMGLKRVYLGIESGNQDLLQFLKKPQLTDDIIELTNRLQAGGINLGIIFLVGAGGQFFAENHLKDSLSLLKKLPLKKGDIIYLSEFYETNPEYKAGMEKSGYSIPSRSEIRSMAENMKKNIKSTVSSEIKVSVYDINQFFY